MESLVIHRINGDGLIDRMVMFDVEDLAAAVEELDHLYAESLDPTDLLEQRILLLVQIHYGGLNADDLHTATAVYHPSAVFIDHRPLGWGPLDLPGIHERMRTLTESPDRYFFYMGRVNRSSLTSSCVTGFNHAVTAEGFVNDSEILSVLTMDPATGLAMRTEQFDPDDLDAALARFDEFVAAESALTIPPNRVVLVGGLANLRARHPEPDRFITGLADDFTATLPDGSTVTLDNLRAGAIAPTDLGFGVTERELIAVRGEQLALLRIEGSRWSIEQIDEHDRLVHVTLFEHDDLLAAANAFELTAREIPNDATVPEPIGHWLDAHRNNDVIGQTELTHDDFSMVDHRPLGYGTLDKENGLALFHVRNEDETLRGVPVYGVVHAANDHACVLAGALWTQGGAGDYWIGLPFIGVYGSADGKLRTVDLFAEGDLDGAMTHFDELSERPEPTSAERLLGEMTAMINERRLDDVEARLTDGFTDESRRTGYSFVVDRSQYVVGLHIFAEQGQFVENLGVIATAGDLAGLHRCEVTGDDTVSSFLQIGVFDIDGNLSRMIEFDHDHLDDALDELARVTGQPVTLLPPAMSQF